MAVTPTKRDVPVETTSKLDDLKRRFALLGATDDEVASMTAAWNGDGDAAYTDEEKRALVAASDGTLTEWLANVRSEYDFHTTTEDEAAQREADEAWAAALEGERLGAADAVNGNVDSVLAWVHEDGAQTYARAQAVIDAEHDLNGDAARVTLIDPLEALLNTEPGAEDDTAAG